MDKTHIIFTSSWFSLADQTAEVFFSLHDDRKVLVSDCSQRGTHQLLHFQLVFGYLVCKKLLSLTFEDKERRIIQILTKFEWQGGRNRENSPHSYRMNFKMLSSSSKLLASHIERPSMYSGSFLSLFSRAAGSWPCVLPAPVDSRLLTSWRALRRCSTFLSAVWSSSVRASFLPDLCFKLILLNMRNCYLRSFRTNWQLSRLVKQWDGPDWSGERYKILSPNR